MGQVRQLLFVQQLHQGEANYDCGGTVEEGPESGDEEGYEGVCVSDGREGDDGGCDRVLEGGWRREGDGGGDRRSGGAREEGDGRAGELRLYQGELCGEARPECSGGR